MSSSTVPNRLSEFAAVLAVKSTRTGKSRLSSQLSPDTRQALIKAMLADTLAALTNSGISQIFLVTNDADITGDTNFTPLSSVQIVAEPARHPTISPLNWAYQQGAALALKRAQSVLLIQADLPTALSTSILELIDYSVSEVNFLADHSGKGTSVMLLNSVKEVPILKFGVNSAAAHRELGYFQLPVGHWPDLECDIDTPSDLQKACLLGLGTQSKQVLNLG